jgi:hypothetical protein
VTPEFQVVSKKKQEKRRLSPIATTLGRVTNELRKVAARLEKVQHAVGRLVFDSASPRSAHFRDLQEITGIAAFLERLASDVPSHWMADSKGASLAIALHELASSLGRHEACETEAKEPVVIHEYEIFD